MRAAALSIAVLALAAGCTVGPDYERPSPPRPASLGDTARVTSDPAAIRFTTQAPADRWWEVFEDPELDRLVERARKNNPGLLAALDRVQAARAVSRQAFAPLLPWVSTNQQHAYERRSKASSGFDADSRVFEGAGYHKSTADVSYELDLWGRIRRSVEAADAKLVATEEDRKNAEITLIADVVQTYFDLGAADARRALTLDAIATRQRSFDLIRARLGKGLATRLELARSEGELASAGVDLPDALRERALAEHRLALLTGEPPGLAFDGKAPGSFALPPEVPVGLPSALLERRPDVRRAEANLVAANARIGVAKAEYFPKVTIVGHVGASALDVAKMSNPAAQLWSVGPQVSVPIFEAGRVQASVLEAEAQKSEAGHLYRETVLRAFGEVADAIASVGAREAMRDREQAAVLANERTWVLAEQQYRAGLVDHLVVLDAQRALLASRTGLLRAQRELLGELVRLQKALGGGWTAEKKE